MCVAADAALVWWQQRRQPQRAANTSCHACLRCTAQVTAADDDYTHNNISHDFLSTKSQTLDAIFRVLTLLLPDALFTFSAAKYCKQGHIKPHDDRAYTQVDG